MADAFLRRYMKSKYKRGVLSPEAFQCRDGEAGLSLHRREPPLHTDEGIRAYQTAFRLPSGDLQGICEIGADRFPESLHPVRVRPPQPEAYAEQHHEIGCPNPDEAAYLALSAVSLLDYVKAPSR